MQNLTLLPEAEAIAFNKELQEFLDARGLHLEAEPRFMKQIIKNPNGTESLAVFSQVVQFLAYKKVAVGDVISPIQDVNPEATA